MNSHELHSETERWTIPKTPWAERICHLYDSMSVEMKITFSWISLFTPTLYRNSTIRAR